MSPLQIIGLVLLFTAVAVTAGGVAAWLRRDRTVRRVRSEASGVLGELATASDRATGEFEAALAGMRSADGAGLSEWFGRIVRTGRQHGQTLDAVQSRLERLAAVERGLATTAAEVARQRDRVDELCRTAEAADPADLKAAAVKLTVVTSDVVSHERRLRAEVTDAKARLEGRVERLVEAERDALTDPVTRLPNRRAFEERLASVAGRADASPFAVAVAVVAVDLPEPRGANRAQAEEDAVLAVAGRVLREAARPRDFVARVGANEFGVLLPGAEERTAAAVMASCRRAAEAAAVRSGAGAVGFLFRGGIAAWQAGESGAAVLERAREEIVGPSKPGATCDAAFSESADCELARVAG